MSLPQVSVRKYNARSLKVLWGRSAGRCSMPECRVELLVDDSEYDPVVIIGDIAHVVASSNEGPRGNKCKNIGKRDEYENLILLCKNCHAKIDGQKKKFTVDAIKKIKADHEAWVRTSLPERGQSNTGWETILLQGVKPFDAQRAIDALSPDYPEGKPHLIAVCPEKEEWRTIYQRIALVVNGLFERSDPFNKRFAVFPLAPVSACVTLGFCLSDRPRVRLFHYHRYSQSWNWKASRRGDAKPKVVGLPARANHKHGQIVICFEISAKIQKVHINAVGEKVIGAISIQVPRPSTSWLRSERQLDELGRIAHETFEIIQNQFPNATSWHLLLATPAPVAVRIGQAMNHTMIPRVQLYEFNRSATPSYIPSIQLSGGTYE